MSSRGAMVAVLMSLGSLCRGEVSCPASVRLNEKLDEPAGWRSQSSTRQTSFLRISVLNQNPGGPEFDLAPSSTVQGKNGELTQVWKLTESRDMNVVLRCRYRNTESVLNIDLPSSLQTCTFKFRLDAKGNFLGTSAATCK